MALTNSQVVPAIAAGRAENGVSNGTGSFWGTSNPSRFARVNRGYIPHAVGSALDAVAEKHGGVQAIIFSYATPIAVKIAGAWLRPDVTYSATTSSRHQSQLWQLDAKWLPADASVDDVENVIAGFVVYDPWKKSFRRGHAARPETQRYWRELAARELAEAVAA